MVLQNARHELLADSAALALGDGYYREAVASFAAALEAFWWFYVRVAARKLGAPAETLARLGKALKLSERRVGAMHLAHLLLVRSPYDGDDEKSRKFRNDVVHDGRFPTRVEAYEYAAHVYKTILDGVGELVECTGDCIAAETAASIAGPHADAFKTEPSARRVTMHISTLLSRAASVQPRPSFKGALQEWKATNAWDLARTSEALNAAAGPSRDADGRDEPPPAPARP
jgi:hypothetical protein